MRNKQIHDFFTKVAQDESFKAEVLKLQKEMERKKLSEQEVQKFVKETLLPKAKKLGYNFSESDMIRFSSSHAISSPTELPPEELANVSGGVFLLVTFIYSLLLNTGSADKSPYMLESKPDAQITSVQSQKDIDNSVNKTDENQVSIYQQDIKNYNQYIKDYKQYIEERKQYIKNSEQYIKERKQYIANNKQYILELEQYIQNRHQYIKNSQERATQYYQDAMDFEKYANESEDESKSEELRVKAVEWRQLADIEMKSIDEDTQAIERYKNDILNITKNIDSDNQAIDELKQSIKTDRQKIDELEQLIMEYTHNIEKLEQYIAHLRQLTN